MKRTHVWLCVFALALLVVNPAAEAKVSPEEAAKLQSELTPTGAVRAGNAGGSIPEWTGGITTPPAGYKKGMRHIDPFAGDKPAFSITAENLDQHRAFLSTGQIAMFERYPKTWKMHIYPSRRTFSVPERIYEASIANATRAELSSGGNGVMGAAEGIPFPIPQSGVEAIWNHLLRYRGDAAEAYYVNANPTAGGDYTEILIHQQVLFAYAMPGATIESIDNKAIYFLQKVMAPARLAGEMLLVHETLDQIKQPRQAWTYNPGQRRVRRAPNIAYDNPGTASDGQRTADQLDQFNGAPDRYEWTLVGKKEMYIPYNPYKLHGDEFTNEQLIVPGHLNPEALRNELHRVWVVEAKLRPGTSHIYARRTFYIDEDSWQVTNVDAYDKRGQIWRVSEGYAINYYEVPVMYTSVECHYDLQNGRYSITGLNDKKHVEDFDVALTAEDFKPEGLRRAGRR